MHRILKKKKIQPRVSPYIFSPTIQRHLFLIEVYYSIAHQALLPSSLAVYFAINLPHRYSLFFLFANGEHRKCVLWLFQFVLCSNVHSPSAFNQAFFFIHQKVFVCPFFHVSSVYNSIRVPDSNSPKPVNQTRKRKNFKMNILNSFSLFGVFSAFSILFRSISSYFIHVHAIIVIVFMCFKLKFDLLTMNVPTRHENALLRALNPIFLFPLTAHTSREKKERTTEKN